MVEKKRKTMKQRKKETNTKTIIKKLIHQWKGKNTRKIEWRIWVMKIIFRVTKWRCRCLRPLMDNIVMEVFVDSITQW